jgi:hypothetical protein
VEDWRVPIAPRPPLNPARKRVARLLHQTVGNGIERLSSHPENFSTAKA